MDFTLLAFYAFAAVAVLAAGAVIAVRNPVHAALCLVLAIFSVACTWILAGAEFLGLALVLVYVGAVMVLFLFVVMMLDIDIARMREGYVRFLPVGLVVAVAMLVEILVLIGVRGRAAVPFADNAARAVAGVQRGDFLIVTHAHSRKFAAERCEEVLAAFDREELPGADDRYDIEQIVQRMISDG